MGDTKRPSTKPDHKSDHKSDIERTDTADPTGLSEEELAQQQGEELPDREAMSLINGNVALPVNAAVALNALSDNSVAYANAEQDITLDQSN